MLDTVNPYVKVFRNARDIFEADNVINLSIRIIKARPGRQYTLPTVDEVAALIVGGDVGDEEYRDIIVRKIGRSLQRYMKPNHHICLFNTHSYSHMERMVGQLTLHMWGDQALLEER